jgi:hypothetical protein
MKHLKVAGPVVNLAILIFCSISCSSVPGLLHHDILSSEI